MFNALFGSYKNWQKQSATSAELRKLSARELDDLGLIPGDVQRRVVR